MTRAYAPVKSKSKRKEASFMNSAKYARHNTRELLYHIAGEINAMTGYNLISGVKTTLPLDH